MGRLTVNPSLLYNQNASKVAHEKKQSLKKVPSEKSLVQKEKVNLSDKSKDLKQKLTSAQKAIEIQHKKFGKIDKPGIYFVSGFDWFGASSVKGSYDGIKDMADAIKGAQHYSWDQQSEIIEDIKKRDPKVPIVLVGHSFGGDGVVEIAQELNSIENGFRKIDLLVTLDSVGFDNDFIPQNVKKNLNYLAQGPYKFLNDGPNIALNYERTEVQNFLRHEKHAELDDVIDIQIQIIEEVDKLLKKE